MKQRKDYDETHRACIGQFAGIINNRKIGKDYHKLVTTMKEKGFGEEEITNTLYWKWTIDKEGDRLEQFFYNTPPISKAEESNRVLVTGTDKEVKDLVKFFDVVKQSNINLKKEMRSLKHLEGTLSPKLLLRAPKTYGYLSHLADIEDPEYCFASQVGAFWGSFFGEEDFLDDTSKITVPAAIIGTGNMRNYDSHNGGETLDVAERLREIAKDWEIPIYIIQSWAL